jgi:hypothetical protein
MLDGMTPRERSFTPEELLQIKAVVEESPEAHRFAISKKVCEVLGWHQRKGRLKDCDCREVLARLHDIGFLRLPPPRRPAVRRRPLAAASAGLRSMRTGQPLRGTASDRRLRTVDGAGLRAHLGRPAPVREDSHRGGLPGAASAPTRLGSPQLWWESRDPAPFPDGQEDGPPVRG